MFLVCIALSGCGGPLRYTLRGTAKAPGADALIEADVKTEAAMSRLKVTIKNLPPPDRLDANATDFIVWVRANDKTSWQRVGGLEYDADAREGELLEASVPLTRFDLSITVEKQRAPASPSPAVLFAQTVEDD